MILILGGTTQASLLARALAERPDIAAMMSLAGRVARPVLPPIACRVGGFGGAEGLAAFLRDNAVEALIDATHPFAVKISRNAVAAAQKTNTPFLALRRPAWRPVPGDRWIETATTEEAAASLGEAPRRVFLTIGRLDLPAFVAKPQHVYWVRTLDPAEILPPQAHAILARGPFAEADERRLLREHEIEVVVTKNSGGEATYGKIAAARSLGLPVILVRPPSLPDAPTVETAREAMAWIEGIHPFSPLGV